MEMMLPADEDRRHQVNWLLMWLCTTQILSNIEQLLSPRVPSLPIYTRLFG
jgi:hypothetical protein